MSQGVEVWGGGVNTWECDEMGHLNVRFWVAKAFEGLAGLAAQLGMPRAFATSAAATLVVREQHIRFLREARPGACLIMHGGVVEMGETDARLLLVIRHLSGEPAASFQVQVSHVTGSDLRPFPWPARILAKAAELQVEVPAFAAARGLDLAPVMATASHERALALGLTRIGMGVIQPGECDVFGRMRGEMFIGRVSDGVSRLFGESRPGPVPVPGAPQLRIGGAVLEYRVLYLGWPQAGDSVELRSGIAGCDHRTRQVIHWMVDPISGRPWCSAQAVVISLDLDARMVVDISPQAQAEIRAQITPGLAL